MIAVVNANARFIPLSDQSVQCVITSPPYWQLRSYLDSTDPNKRLELGAEPTPAAYVANIVAVMREVWRVGRDDMTCWLNLGDSFLDKQLVGIPWRVAFALQDDGWYLRQEIIWSKPNPMPESVTDRCTKSHESIFLLTKQARYYYDAEAIREPLVRVWDSQTNGGSMSNGRHDAAHIGGSRRHERPYPEPNPAGRNKRSVWTIATSPYSGAHFATFPPKLVEPMILAGTSQRGACPTCGTGWVRVVEKIAADDPDGYSGSKFNKGKTAAAHPNAGVGQRYESEPIGWRPACACYDVPPLPAVPEDSNDDNMEAYRAERARVLDIYTALPTVPQIVLDPFCGTATVGQVCAKHRRNFIGADLSMKYIKLGTERTSSVQQVIFL